MSTRHALTVAIAQINPMVGDFAGNLEIAKDAFQKAGEQQAQLVVFPELSVCGYYPGDLLNESAFIRKAYEALAELTAFSTQFPGITAIVGMPKKFTGPGKPLYNALIAVHNGEIIAEYHKQLLPTYNIFDERRHFEPGQQGAVSIEIGGYKVGLMICEDGWNDNADDYPVNPYEALAEIRPDLVVSINASPSNIGKRAQRHQVICGAARRHGLPILYVNQVGGQDSIVFDGASFAVNADGEIAREWPAFQTVIDTLRFAEDGFQTIAQPAEPQVDNDQEFILQHILLGLRDYVRRCGFQQVVVGSSGGIDSALTIAIAAEALGPENVIAITMPSAFSSSGSVSDSQLLCDALGVPLFSYPIKTLVSDFGAQFHSSFTDELRGLSLENLQARLRGTILMAYSNHSGAMVLTTGNKSEISVGYCTLYGDTNGGLGLIGDLYKTEVYRLSAYINQRAGRVIIPEAILTKPPSAELAPDQKDTDSLPPYEVLDEILKLLIEGKQLADHEYQQAHHFVTGYRATAAGEAVYQRIVGMIARNEYKRRQAPPIIRVRPRAFGAGRQMPIAAKH
ncbi:MULTISPECIES: NAD+ synthase [Methylomonas]|uniref:Glutamine-dependent NAD(+) synthetase n=2 Tax=Methylomonas TaxID=416 RepID=A0A126T4V7_9GAMM|nr:MULTISPECIES: NAD+ synthase [Methylomonas]AMK77106.1 NAD+ synthetase [Methylomonas denitrificans]OAH97151.1 NAD+ synthase [Methylomonas methanica]TCV82616.1 NAD+ synthase (glutamine-hydrolysing) [Methylomonas methanica]